MATITLTIPDELANELRTLDPADLTTVLREGLARYQTEQLLEEHLRQMQTDDVVAATHQAKERSHAIIEDQGFAAVALLFTNFLADAVQSTRQQQTPKRTPVTQ